MVNTILFDRDGVINDVIMRDGVVSSPRSHDEFRILPEFIEFYNVLKQHNLRMFVVSNQPDISRNLLESKALEAMNERLKEQFDFVEILYCTHDDSHCCHCRKPKPGMIISLLEKYNLDPKRTIMIGDSKKDVEAGRAAGVTTIYVRRGYNSDAVQAEFTVHSLREILELVTFTDDSQ